MPCPHTRWTSIAHTHPTLHRAHAQGPAPTKGMLVGTDHDEISVALQIAIVHLGYDRDHDRRLELCTILTRVQGGAQFPGNIVDHVQRGTGGTSERIDEVLRLQVPAVLASCTAAIQHEEQLRAELAAAEEAERQLRLAEESRLQARLKSSGRCPAGFAWHQEGSGWRCNGGSHFVSDLSSL